MLAPMTFPNATPPAPSAATCARGRCNEEHRTMKTTYDFTIKVPVDGDDAHISVSWPDANPRSRLNNAIAGELYCAAEEACRGIRRGLLNGYEQGPDDSSA
jgi:hypothetical protein